MSTQFGGDSTGNGAGTGQRLIVVSNRLPVTISKDSKGEYHFKVGFDFSQAAFGVLELWMFAPFDSVLLFPIVP